jgi:hypothetical protein
VKPDSVFGRHAAVRPERATAGGNMTSAARAMIARSRRESGTVTWLRIFDSGSMKPLVDGTCHGLIDWSGGASARKGDVILIDDEVGLLLAHRLIGRHAGGRILQIADVIDLDTPYSGYFVNEGRVLGRVVQLQRRGRTYNLNARLPRLLGWCIARSSEAVWDAIERQRPGPVVAALLRAQTMIRHCALIPLRCYSRTERPR